MRDITVHVPLIPAHGASHHRTRASNPRTRRLSVPPSVYNRCVRYGFSSGRFDDGCCVDLVAFPSTEAQISALLRACTAGVRGRPICVVPWGGGSSVSHGLGAPSGSAHYSGCICVDLIKLDKLVSVDKESLSVKVCVGCQNRRCRGGGAFSAT